MRMMNTIAGLAALLGGLAACGASTAPNDQRTPPPNGSNDVTVSNNVFSPSSVTVSAGQTIVWTWDACTGGGGYGSVKTCVNHKIVFDDGAKSALQSEGAFSRTFAAKGVYPYHCQVHGLSMAGTITVQ